MATQAENFVQNLEKKLKEAGLPADLTKVVGQIFCFHWEENGAWETISSTIAAIALDEGGLYLHTPNAAFGNRRVLHLRFIDKGWAALAQVANNRTRYIHGRLQLPSYS